MVGIGNSLGELMEAIHATDIPLALQGLTLFVMPKDGRIDLSKRADDGYGVEAAKVPAFRKAVLEFDWSDVAFTAPDTE